MTPSDISEDELIAKEFDSRRPQIIDRPNQLLMKLGNPKNISMKLDPKTLKEIETAIDQQSGQFQAVLEESLAKLNALIGQAGDFDEEIKDQVRAVAHELKGVAGTFGYHLLTEIANSLQLFLEEVEGVPDYTRSIASMHVNAMNAAASIKGQPDDTSKQVVEGLKVMIQKFTVAA